MPPTRAAVRTRYLERCDCSCAIFRKADRQSVEAGVIELQRAFVRAVSKDGNMLVNGRWPLDEKREAILLAA